MAGILALGFTLRAYKLLSMFPILVDESIYLRWAEIIGPPGPVVHLPVGRQAAAHLLDTRSSAQDL